MGSHGIFAEDPNETTDLINSDNAEDKAAKAELIKMIQDAVHDDSYYVSFIFISSFCCMVHMTIMRKPYILMRHQLFRLTRNEGKVALGVLHH